MINIEQSGTNPCLIAAQLVRPDDLRKIDQYSWKMAWSEYQVLKSQALNFCNWSGSNKARDSTQELTWSSTSASIGLKTRSQGQVLRRSGRTYWGWEDMFSRGNLCSTGCWKLRLEPVFYNTVHGFPGAYKAVLTVLFGTGTMRGIALWLYYDTRANNNLQGDSKR